MTVGVARRLEPRDDDASSTRDDLLQAVIALAGEEGFGGVTHRAVAARAQVTHGLVRHYFGTRQTMLAEALNLAIRDDQHDVTLRTDSVDDFGNGLDDLGASLWNRRALQYEVVLGAVRGSSDRALAEDLYASYEDQIADTLAALGIEDPDGRWRVLLFAALDGLVLQHGLFRDATRTGTALDALRQVLRSLAAGQIAQGTAPEGT